MFPIVGAVVLIPEDRFALGPGAVLGMAWVIGVVSAVTLSLAASTIGDALRRGDRRRATGAGDQGERWSQAVLAGLVSCVLVGPVAILVTRDPLVAAGVCGFVVAANVVAWGLVRCPPAVVVQWLALLGAAAVVVVVLGPDPSPLSVALVSVCFAVLLGRFCSRSPRAARPLA